MLVANTHPSGRSTMSSRMISIWRLSFKKMARSVGTKYGQLCIKDCWQNPRSFQAWPEHYGNHYWKSFFNPDDEGKEDIGPADSVDDLAAELASVVARCCDAAATTKKRALGIFKINQTENANEATSYTIIMPRSKVKLFSLVIRYVLYGTSLRQTFSIVSMTYQVMQDPILRSCLIHLVSTYAWVACAVSLQRI